MNYEMIEALMELYNKHPWDDGKSAAMRVAVLVEMELLKMEADGINITRETLAEAFKDALKGSTKEAA